MAKTDLTIVISPDVTDIYDYAKFRWVAHAGIASR